MLFGHLVLRLQSHATICRLPQSMCKVWYSIAQRSTHSKGNRIPHIIYTVQHLQGTVKYSIAQRYTAQYLHSIIQHAHTNNGVVVLLLNQVC